MIARTDFHEPPIPYLLSWSSTLSSNHEMWTLPLRIYYGFNQYSTLDALLLRLRPQVPVSARRRSLRRSVHLFIGLHEDSS